MSSRKPTTVAPVVRMTVQQSRNAKAAMKWIRGRIAAVRSEVASESAWLQFLGDAVHDQYIFALEELTGLLTRCSERMEAISKYDTNP